MERSALTNSLKERFFRYVKINTQSDAASETSPSTKSQLEFGKLLVQELKELGVKDVTHDEFGYVTVRVPSNSSKKVPVILFTAHLDTSPDYRSENVNPIIHENYDGNPIYLPSKPSCAISMNDFPELKDKIGRDIITSDGTTLLGADDKAGVSELMEVISLLVKEPDAKHGDIIFLFVPDEEIGKDVLHLDVKNLGADYGYTIDGHHNGSINNETFAIGSVTLIISGQSIHTGAGRGLMENSVRIGSEIIYALPADIFPEVTKDREGFVHVASFEGKMSHSKIIFKVRAFNEKELHELSVIIKSTVQSVIKRFPRSEFDFSFKITDKNIGEILKKHPVLIDNAAEAMRRAGLEPKISPLRGATTGTGLTFNGLPTANLFTGQHGNHGNLEWICLQDMEKSVQAIFELCKVWESNS